MAASKSAQARKMLTELRELARVAEAMIDGELAECLSTGKITTVAVEGSDDYLTVLAPVRDSLGDVVGCVELTAAHPASKHLVPAWS